MGAAKRVLRNILKVLGTISFSVQNVLLYLWLDLQMLTLQIIKLTENQFLVRYLICNKFQ